MSPESEQMRRELQCLSRRELQALAKQEGVRANGSSADIVNALLAAAAGAAADPSHASAWRQGAGKPDQPHASASSSSSSRSGTGDVASRGGDQCLGIAGTAAAGTPRHGQQQQQSLHSAHRPATHGGQLTCSSTVADAACASQQLLQQRQQQRLQLKLEQLRMSPPRGVTGRGLLPARQPEPAAAEAQRAASPRGAPSAWHVAMQQQQQQQQQQPAPLSAASLAQERAGLQDRDQLRRDRLAAAAAANRAAHAQQAEGSQQVLHTPRRVRVPGASAAVSANLLATPPGNTAAVAGGGSGAVTPPGQRSSAFGAGSAGLGPAATPQCNAAAPAGLLSPRPLGTARRVAVAAARAGGTAAAAGTGAPPPGVSAAAAAPSGLPATPLQQPARRRVPAEAEQPRDGSARQLEQLVERCVRIAHPGAAAGVLQGPEPAKAWLRSNIVEPLTRSRAVADRSSSSSRHASLLLYGPPGSGKTELVHGLAGGLGCDLLYLPAGELLRSSQADGAALLRALFRVARRIAPVVVCFDDAHLTFPLRLSSNPDPDHPGLKLLVELLVQLQQLEDASSQLQARLAQRHGSSSSGVEAAAPPSARKRPAWGTGGAPRAAATPQQQPQQQQQQQQRAGCSVAAGPVVVLFVTRAPEALEPRLLEALPVRLLLDLPCAESREELLAGWLVGQEAALGVQEVEALARDTEGFSCADLLQLCAQAALRPLQQRSRRALVLDDFAAALGRVAASVTPQRRAQLRAWGTGVGEGPAAVGGDGTARC